MIQRIQTVFLFLSAVFAGILFFAPVASFNVGGELVNMSIFGVENHANALLLLILAILMLVVPMVTIFMYKKRELQLKLSSLNVFLNALFCGLIFLFYVDNVQNKLQPVSTSANFALSSSMLSPPSSTMACR